MEKLGKELYSAGTFLTAFFSIGGEDQLRPASGVAALPKLPEAIASRRFHMHALLGFYRRLQGRIYIDQGKASPPASKVSAVDIDASLNVCFLKVVAKGFAVHSD